MLMFVLCCSFIACLTVLQLPSAGSWQWLLTGPLDFEGGTGTCVVRHACLVAGAARHGRPGRGVHNLMVRGGREWVSWIEYSGKLCLKKNGSCPQTFHGVSAQCSMPESSNSDTLKCSFKTLLCTSGYNWLLVEPPAVHSALSVPCTSGCPLTLYWPRNYTASSKDHY